MAIKRITEKKKTAKNKSVLMTAATVFTAGAMLLGFGTLTTKAEAYTYSMPAAGASIVLEEYLKEQQSLESVQNASLQNARLSLAAVSAPMVASAGTNEEALDYIKKNYTNLGIANVRTWLNVRVSPGGKINGRLLADGACEVIEEHDGWIKIKSGDIEGYVSSDYLLTGDLAIERALNAMSSVAKVDVSGLNMRKSANTSSKVQRVLSKGTEVEILEDYGEWLKISYNNTVGYIFAEYAKQEYELSEALSLDEIKYGKEVSDLREQVVAYAKQFVGNPYVYGGNSLTKGTDCSGFVKLIMAHFGITTPRTATTQYNAGKKISVSELLPGDLIVYGDRVIEHIGIYIGDGQIVHASNKKTGIKYSNYNYRKIYGCVRFIED